MSFSGLKGERGMVSVFALSVLFVLTFLSAGIYTVTQKNVRTVSRFINGARLSDAARSGILRGISLLNSGSVPPPGAGTELIFSGKTGGISYNVYSRYAASGAALMCVSEMDGDKSENTRVIARLANVGGKFAAERWEH